MPKLLLLSAFLCALAIYLPTLRFGFLLDDNHLIVGNPRMETWKSIPYFFSHHLWPGTPYYRPLTLVSQLTLSMIFGWHAWAFHLFDVVLYLLVIGMVYVTGRSMQLSAVASGWAALFFAVHPVHLEVGAWATGATESLLALPLLIAFCCYVRARENPARAVLWLTGAMLSYGFALLAKEVAIIFPILLILWESLAKDRSSVSRIVLRITPFAAMTAFYFALHEIAVGTFSATITPLPLRTKLLTLPTILVFYAEKFFAPSHSSFFYDHYYVTDFSSRALLLAAGCIVLAIFAAYAIARGWLTRPESFLVLAATVSLLPSLNLSAFVWREMAHDRYLYLASVFLALALGSLAARQLYLGSARRSCAVAVMVAYPLLLMAVSESQVNFYRDEFTAFAHAAQIAPNNLYVIRYLIGELQDRGRTQEAQAWLDRANRVTPDWWYAYEVGLFNFEKGNLPAAENLTRRALAMQAQPEQHRLLAQILEKEGKCQEAQKEWKLSFFPRPDGPACATH